MLLETRTYLVTGASSGIGRAVARNLLAQGHRVLGIARDCSRFTHQHPYFASFAMDLSQFVDLPEACKRLLEAYPQLDGAIFCAGIGAFGSLEQFSCAQIETLMMVNFTSQACLARMLLPILKRQKRGDLIFMGSEAALKGSRKGAVYCASKFALRGFTQALREECGKSQVRVALVNPGMVQTPFFDELSFEPGAADGEFIAVDDIAEAVSYIINSDARIVIDEINLSPLNKVVRFK